jgi:tetratricopeptide (TPR) repeat protein
LEFNKSIENNPYNYQAYCKRAKLNLYMGNFRDGKIDACKALQLNSECAEAYYLRGKAFLYFNDLTQALSDFNKVLVLEPGNPKALSRTR